MQYVFKQGYRSLCVIWNKKRDVLDTYLSLDSWGVLDVLDVLEHLDIFVPRLMF